MDDTRGTVLVTGSSGLIGTKVVQRLAGQYHVVCLDRDAPSGSSPGEFIETDVGSDDSVRQSLQRVRDRHGERIASVVHLAAYYDFKGEPSDKYEQITVRGTQRLLTGLRSDFRCEQFVFASTMLVHAPCEPGQRINEDSPLDPKWDYPESKARTERLIHEQRGDVPAVILRIAGVYDEGGHSPPLTNQMQRVYEKQLTGHFYPADTSRGQAFVHLDDLVDAIALVVERRRQLPAETTLLIGEPQTLSYEELQQTFGRLIHGEAWSTYWVPKPVAKVGAWAQDNLPLGPEPFIKPWMIDRADDHYELDVSRARKRIGWEPKRSLRQTLPRMVEALKRDPAGFYKANKLQPPSGSEAAAEKGA